MLVRGTSRGHVAITQQVRARAFASARQGSIRHRFREPESGKPRAVMAYSGGLDTSCQLAWLTKVSRFTTCMPRFTDPITQEKGYEVCAYVADLGQDDVLTDEMVNEIAVKAETSGA